MVKAFDDFGVLVFGDFGILIFFVTVVLLYFVPTMVAVARHHSKTLSIFLVNFFLGITGIAWGIALVWAFMNTMDASSSSALKSRIAKVLLKITLVLFAFFVLLTIWVKRAAI